MRRALVLGATALLALPGVANAKGPIQKATVCGSDGCASVVLPRAAKGREGLLLVFGTSPTSAPRPGPYYRLRILASGERFALFYAGGRSNDGSSGSWFTVSEPLRSAIDRALAGRTPSPYRLASVLVGGRKSGHPNAFLPLVGRLPDAPSGGDSERHAKRAIPIQLLAAGHTPWTSVTLFYDPVNGTVSTPFTAARWLQAPPSVRAAVERVVGRTGAAPIHEGSSHARVWAVVAAVAAAALLAVAWLWRRSRPRTARVA
jgi:hypothetical protein